jgi:hypothetical protein
LHVALNPPCEEDIVTTTLPTTIPNPQLRGGPSVDRAFLSEGVIQNFLPTLLTFAKERASKKHINSKL